MKIGLFMVTILEFGGGTEQYLVRTAAYLSRQYGIEIDIITMDDRFTDRVRRMAQFYYFKRFEPRLMYQDDLAAIHKRLEPATYKKCRSFAELRKTLNEYDVIYSKNELLEAALLKSMLHYSTLPPIVFGCHTPLQYEEAPSIQARLHNALYSSWIYRYLADGVKAFHVLNATEYDVATRLFPHTRVVQIPHPFNVTQFRKSAKEHPYRYAWDRTKTNILWVGRLTEQKGVDELEAIIRAFNAGRLGDSVSWHIVGDGEQRSKAEILANSNSNVHWHGRVDHQYMPSIYESCDLLISTSKWESFGLNILEAQACGMPAISYRISGPDEIVIDGQSGFLVDSREALVNRISLVVEGKAAFRNITSSIVRRFDEKGVYGSLVAELNAVAMR
jgi:glycosyltransferase involved in cell wall biosynthesis